MADIPTALRDWRWCDIDPAAHTFDPAFVRESAIANIIPGRRAGAICGCHGPRLAELFANLPHVNASVEHAAAHLLPLVVERTDASDAWYATYAMVLRCYLESCGVQGIGIRNAIDETIGERFRAGLHQMARHPARRHR